MFTNPHVQPSEIFPALPVDTPEFADFITELAVPLQPGQDVVPQLVAHARGFWLDRGAASRDPSQGMPFRSVPQFGLLERSGVIDAIEPYRARYDYALIDGGTFRVFNYRLEKLDELLANGITSDVTIFAGQRRRFTNDDSSGKLEDLAAAAHGSTTDWGRRWIEAQLAKNPHADNLWDRPFAAEQDIATLALICRYGDRLQHKGTLLRPRKEAKSDVSGIPDAPILAEEFMVDGVNIRVLYGKAVKRSYAGQTPYTPRPTARSCFAEWLKLTQPGAESSVLVLSHNPNIYRTWTDIMLGRTALDRTDLQIDGAGASIENDRSYNYVLRGVGSIFINYHSLLYGNDGSHLTSSTW